MSTVSNIADAVRPVERFYLRSGADRRDTEERRQVHDLSYFENGGVERRSGRERRTEPERRAGWVRVSQWHSICLQPARAEAV